MSIDRRFLFGPGPSTEVYVVPTNDGRALVLDARGQPLGVVEAPSADAVGGLVLDARGQAIDLFELASRASGAIQGFTFDARGPAMHAARTTDLVELRANGSPGAFVAPHRESADDDGVPAMFRQAMRSEHTEPLRPSRERAGATFGGVRTLDHHARGAQLDRGWAEARGFEQEPRSERAHAAQTKAFEDPDRARGAGSGVVRFALLGQIRGALAEALAANHALVDQASGRDRRDTAEDLASAVLQTLGVELPNTAWVPNTRESRTWGGRLRLGEDLAQRAKLPELVQLLLHETGRVHSPRHAAAAGTLLAALASEGYLTREAHEALQARSDATSLTFAALGAWMFGAGQRPKLDATLAHVEAPEGSASREDADAARTLGVLVDALDRASAEGAFERTLARHDGPLDRAPPPAAKKPWIFGED